MEKDRRRRLDSAADARLEIEDGLTAPMADAGAAPRTREAQRWIIEAAISIALIALAIPVAWYFSQAPPPFAPAMRTSIVTPTTTDPFSFALSPDGRQLAFVASGGGPSRLWLRSMANVGAATGWNRGRRLSILVAGQSLSWLFCRRQVEVARY
jgi:hypothetical protein